MHMMDCGSRCHEPSSVAQGWRQFSPSHTTEYCLPTQEAAYWCIAIFIGGITGRPLGALSPLDEGTVPQKEASGVQIWPFFTQSLISPCKLNNMVLPCFQLHQSKVQLEVMQVSGLCPHNISTTVLAVILWKLDCRFI